MKFRKRILRLCIYAVYGVAFTAYATTLVHVQILFWIDVFNAADWLQSSELLKTSIAAIPSTIGSFSICFGIWHYYATNIEKEIVRRDYLIRTLFDNSLPRIHKTSHPNQLGIQIDILDGRSNHSVSSLLEYTGLDEYRDVVYSLTKCSNHQLEQIHALARGKKYGVKNLRQLSFLIEQCQPVTLTQ